MYSLIVSIRNYLCNSIIQILDMTDHDKHALARHLGHDLKTHTEYYRLADSTVELSKVFIVQGFDFCLRYCHFCDWI